MPAKKDHRSEAGGRTVNQVSEKELKRLKKKAAKQMAKNDKNK